MLGNEAGTMFFYDLEAESCRKDKTEKQLFLKKSARLQSRGFIYILEVVSASKF